ncbi:biotin--[acetyl-CoA-carboxylase] ligase [bacterium]|nr:biotin--[acetyl-CoA-carboxylase] ligase [bacterium]
MTAGQAILAVFHRSDGGFVPGSDLQEATRLSAADLHREMAALRQIGYLIESHPHRGYRLVAGPDRLTGDEIRAQLSTTVIGREVLVFEETTSTNDVVERLAPARPGEGTVVFAETQTAGRGRHGRFWTSPRGRGLWFSVLLRPPWPPAAWSRLTIAAALAVARTVRRLGGLDARIKWPNDITLQNRKLAGILTEQRGSVAVLGIGLNVNCQQDDFPPELRDTATSLLLATGQVQHRATLAAWLIEALDEDYRRAQDDFEAVAAAWARWCITLGRQITVQVGSRTVAGIAHALDGDGALLLRRDQGQIERIISGDLVTERP